MRGGAKRRRSTGATAKELAGETRGGGSLRGVAARGNVGKEEEEEEEEEEQEGQEEE